MISEDEWSFIEAGIIQRAELLSRLLEDLYGDQNLLKEGRFPAALLYGNPAFLRPMVGVPVPKHSHLHMLAVDLARSPDGQWWVLADRTQAPPGSGVCAWRIAPSSPICCRSFSYFQCEAAGPVLSGHNGMR